MNVNALEPRKRLDERALEKEEEDYFNEDRYALITDELTLFYFPSYLFCSD